MGVCVAPSASKPMPVRALPSLGAVSLGDWHYSYIERSGGRCVEMPANLLLPQVSGAFHSCQIANAAERGLTVAWLATM